MSDVDPYDILADIRDHGVLPEETEIVGLCNLAIEGVQAYEQLEATITAMDKAGWSVVDVTTDDDDGRKVMLVPPGQDEE